jgi:hypothetical protein
MDRSQSANMHAVREHLSFPKFGLMTITKVILAVALSVGTVFLGVTLSLNFGGIALPQPPIQPRESAAIVVYAGFSDRRGWSLDQVKGTNRHAVASLIDKKSPDAPQ